MSHRSRPATVATVTVALALLTGCGLVEGQASAKEACRDVKSIVSSARAGTIPPAQTLLALEGRLRVGVDDEAVQEGGEAMRAVLTEAATAVGQGAPSKAVAADLSRKLAVAGQKLQPACAEIGEPIL